MPAPITAERGTPASASVSLTRSAAASRPSWASWSVSSGRVRSARIVDAEVGHRDAQVRVPEVDPHGRAGGGVEGQQDRRPAALGAVRRARLGPLDDQPVSLQVGDQAGHGGARQPRPPGDVGARRSDPRRAARG